MRAIPDQGQRAGSTVKEKAMTIGWLLGLTALLPQPVADQTCLAATVYLEARSEPARGQLAVAEVALRRRDMGHYGNTICEVVTAPHQFALTTTSRSFRIDNQIAWNAAWRIAGEALKVWSLPRAQRAVVVPHADHFMRLDANADWAKAPLATIGEHRFYAVD
jgi:spore germination cell wall hydrolase CwlJ-like protein